MGRRLGRFNKNPGTHSTPRIPTRNLERRHTAPFYIPPVGGCCGDESNGRGACLSALSDLSDRFRRRLALFGHGGVSVPDARTRQGTSGDLNTRGAVSRCGRSFGGGLSPAGFTGRSRERRMSDETRIATGGSKLSRGRRRHCFTTSPRSSRTTPGRLAGPLLQNVENRPLFLCGWREPSSPPSHSTTSDSMDSCTYRKKSQKATKGQEVPGYPFPGLRAPEPRHPPPDGSL